MRISDWSSDVCSSDRFSGLVTAWRLAGWPTRRSSESVKATIEDVVRAPSAFSMTLASLPSITATQELVVPRSIPITLLIFAPHFDQQTPRSEEHTSELQSLMRNSYAVFCLKKKHN